MCMCMYMYDIYEYTHTNIYTHLYLFLYPCLHKAMSSHWFLHSQSNTTGFILAFRFSVFVIPFWQQEILNAFTYLHSPPCRSPVSQLY